MRRADWNLRLASVSAAAVLAVAVLAVAEASPGRYLTTEEFLSDVFSGGMGDSASLIVDAELRSEAEQVLGHRFQRLRLRYWHEDNTTAWIIDEVAKTEPVTIGVAVENGKVKSVRILEFRESRGWEIRYPFFTSQFAGARLENDSDLDRRIDSITGATLSVNAVEKVVRLALLLDAHTHSTGEGSAEASS